MDNRELKAGDIVVLKSGGPKMTIEWFGTYSGVAKAQCTWFEGAKKSSELFAVNSLEPATD